tara:strand:+ start:739 stop:1602 length:864 start_codon:yes stop_codon:yes gene_type:complete
MSTIKVEEIQHPSNSNNAVSIGSNSNVALKFAGNQKLITTSAGVSVTGTCTADTLSGSLASSNLTGALPAIDGSALTGISSGVTVQEEGSSLSTAGTTLNFVGAGVTASGTGASKTITVPGGGGSLEYVSTTSVSSNNSTAQIELTGFDTNSIYKIIARKIKFSGSGSTLRIRFLDSSGNYQSNINYWREKGRNSGEEFSNYNYIMCDTDGSTQYMSFIAELHTPAIFNWLYFNGYPPQEQDNRCDIYASFNSSNTSGTINGIRFYMESGYYFQSGTEILLYKYKMS